MTINGITLAILDGLKMLPELRVRSIKAGGSYILNGCNGFWCDFASCDLRNCFEETDYAQAVI